MQKKLIIDDDPAVLDAVSEALTYEGFQVKAVEQSDDILQLANDYQPSLVLVDYILNGINGGELCAQIKSNSLTSNIPVMMMSAYPRLIQSLGNYECDQFLPKPFNLTELTNAVRNLTSTV